MGAEELDQLTDLDEKTVRGDEPVREPDEGAKRTVLPINSLEHVCLGFRLGAKGRRDIRLHDNRDSKPAPKSLRRDVHSTGQRWVPGCPKIRIICGGCGASLFHFEGEPK